MHMHMWYWFGTNLGDFLFQGYNITTTWGLVATCLGLAALAIVYEAMKVLRVKLRQLTLASLPMEVVASGEDSSLLSRISAVGPFAGSTVPPCGERWLRWLIEVLNQSLHTTLGYLLMVAVMTYNGYVSIALALGGGIGYWIFGPTLVQLNMCRINDKRDNMQCDPECSDAIVNAERRRSTVSVIAERLAAEGNMNA